jgi:hypothetical protein
VSPEATEEVIAEDVVAAETPEAAASSESA